MFHSVLSEEDLAHLLGIKRPELRGLVSTLIDDRLVATHSQPEFAFNSRSIRRYYYYIKYPQAIDAIKWKVHQLVAKLKDDLDKNSSPQGYICPNCQSKYTQLEAISLLNFEKTQFLCSLCEEPLTEDDSGKQSKEKQIKLNKLMDQVQPIIDYLKKIDDSMIEENTFESALARLIPPQNNSVASYTINPRTKKSTMFQPGEALDNESSRRAGAKSQATLHVNITTANDEQVQRELQEREAENKRRQNALPTWHEQSTIGRSLGKLDGEDGSITIGGTEHQTSIIDENIEATINMSNLKENDKHTFTQQEIEDKEAERTLAEYYAQLAKKQALEDEDDDEDENENEFEDVLDVNNGEDDDEDMIDLEDIELDNVPEKPQVDITNSTSKQSNESNGEEEDIDAEFEDV